MCYHFTISYFNTVYQNTKSLRAFYLLVQLGSDTACVCVAPAVSAHPASLQCLGKPARGDSCRVQGSPSIFIHGRFSSYTKTSQHIPLNISKTKQDTP